MTPAISVRGLGKEFTLGERERYLTIRESLQRLFTGRRSDAAQTSSKRLWALKDVSFDVMPGEVVGVIGHNGAGKSTLLKILSRITEPSEGRIDIYGRVSSLLEVGTGFHPELTGRENIYLNGSILGMKKREIDAKFDEIVAFSGVERFLQTPVKRYSSGMHVRLAFAVAAHLEPEILLVDEVLAVGDAEFQRKCLGKMGDVARSGRTVLFVSHNMAAVEGLCTKGILLNAGRIQEVGSALDVTRSYFLTLGGGVAGSFDLSSFELRQSKGARLSTVRLLDENGDAIEAVTLGKTFVLEVTGRAEKHLRNAILSIRINSETGQRLVTALSSHQHPERMELDGPFAIRCKFHTFSLTPNDYLIELHIADGAELQDAVIGLPLRVIPGNIYGTGKLLPAHTGIYMPTLEWSARSGTVV